MPSEDLIAIAAKIFRNLWDQRLASAAEQKKSMASELSQIDRKTEQLLDRIVDADSSAVIKAYENRVSEYESRKALLSERIANCGRPARGYDETFRAAMEFLGNPQKLWASERLEDKRAVLKLAFAGHLSYQRIEGFRTPEIALLFKAFGEFSGLKREMARPAGLEPATPSLEGSCSIQLNYGRALRVSIAAIARARNGVKAWQSRFGGSFGVCHGFEVSIGARSGPCVVSLF